MAVAKLYPDPEKGGRGKKNPSLNEAFVAAGGRHVAIHKQRSHLLRLGRI